MLRSSSLFHWLIWRMCFSPNMIVLLVPSVIMPNLVMLRNCVMRVFGGVMNMEARFTLGVVAGGVGGGGTDVPFGKRAAKGAPTTIAPLLNLLVSLTSNPSNV